MAAKAHHPFYHSVSVLTHRLPEQQEATCDLALLIAAEIATYQAAPIGRDMLSENSISTTTVLSAIDRHVPDNGTAENALLRSGLEIVLFRALYDLRHNSIGAPDTLITDMQKMPGRPDDALLH